MKNAPHSIKHKGSYVGIGVGPIKQAGRIYDETTLRDETRRLARDLSPQALEEFMATIHFKGIHQPPKEKNWEWCPLKAFKGYCPACTHIYAVSTSTYTHIPKEEK